MLGQIVYRKPKEMSLGPEGYGIGIHFFGINFDVGCDAATAMNDPVIPGKVFLVVIIIGTIAVIRKNIFVFFIIFLLNAAPGGYIIFRGGNLQKSIVDFVDRVDLLYQTLSESFGADDDTAIQILDGTGNNFRSAGTAAVNQNNQSGVRQKRIFGGLKFGIPFMGATGLYYGLVFRNKDIGDLNC